MKEHFSIDSIRYFVLREMVFGQDGKFSYENLIERANSDLANGLGKSFFANAFDDQINIAKELFQMKISRSEFYLCQTRERKS